MDINKGKSTIEGYVGHYHQGTGHKGGFSIWVEICQIIFIIFLAF